MGSRHQPSNLPRLFPDKDIHKLKWHSKKARTAARLTTSWLTGPASAHYKMYVFGEVRSLLSLAFCCFEAQAQKDWEATSQTSKVRYREAETTWCCESVCPSRKEQVLRQRVQNRLFQSCILPFFYFTPPSRRSEHFYADPTWLNQSFSSSPPTDKKL